MVTKRGRPVARLVPLDADASLVDSVRVMSEDDDLLSTGEVWSTDE